MIKPLITMLWLALSPALFMEVPPANMMRDQRNQKIAIMNKTMSLTGKQTIIRLYEEVLNKRNWNLLNELISAEAPGKGGKNGVEGFLAPLAELVAAFPDAQWKLIAVYEDGDRIIVKQQLTGTHNGVFQGIAATGRKVVNNGIAIYQVSNGKILAHEVQTDRLGFLQELGILPHDLNELITGKAANNK